MSLKMDMQKAYELHAGLISALPVTWSHISLVNVWTARMKGMCGVFYNYDIDAEYGLAVNCSRQATATMVQMVGKYYQCHYTADGY